MKYISILFLTLLNYFLFSYVCIADENSKKININLIKKISIERNSIFINKQEITEIKLDGEEILQQQEAGNSQNYETNEINNENEISIKKIPSGYHTLQLQIKNISSPVYFPFIVHEREPNKDLMNEKGTNENLMKTFIYVDKEGELLEVENGYDMDRNGYIDDNKDWFRTQEIPFNPPFVKGEIQGVNKQAKTLYWYNSDKKELRKLLLKQGEFFEENRPFEIVNADNKFITPNPPLQLSIELPGIYKLGDIKDVYINNMKIPELGIHQYFNEILVDYPYFENIVSQKPVINLNFSNQIKSFKITIKPKTIIILPPPIIEPTLRRPFNPPMPATNPIKQILPQSDNNKLMPSEVPIQFSDTQNAPKAIYKYLIILNIKNAEIIVQENK